jgi:DNA mismatch repair protein MutL
VPTIAILPSALADQIAAGEVVERPASAVKELVENAIDAGAKSIEIEVDEGGRSAIRVSDDGCGMGRDDALLSIERHATSKIHSADDLVGIGTFGFRGEALPSIASVSALTLETALADGAGTVVRVVGGSVMEVADGARRRGTTVSVARLFHNVPARLKFLRSARSEWRAVADAVTSLALAQRGLHLTLTHDGVTAMTLPSATSLRSRVGGIWGGQYADALVDVDDVAGTVYVTGLVERPSDVGTRSRRVVLVINGRAVRDAGLVRAAEAAYRSTIPAGLRPSMFLDITVSAETVDVNVHPAKAEVRFRDRWNVERAVENAVRRALGTIASSHVAGTWGTGFSAPSVADERVLLRSNAHTLGPLDPSPQVEHEEAEIVPSLVQLRRTYLMYEHDEGVVLIDQHSAHERVLFEQFMSTKPTTQRLLFPLTLHLGPAEGDAFEENREYFEQLGFEIEGFGGHSLLVRSVPMPHQRFDAERCLRETLDALTGDRLAGTATRHERLASTVACKAAVKAGDPLSAAEMRALYLALGRTTLPAHDVHGRSTIVRLSWDELERRFGRR